MLLESWTGKKLMTANHVITVSGNREHWLAGVAGIGELCPAVRK